jgi:hypothetical protein
MTGDKMVIRKSCMLALTAVLAIAAAQSVLALTPTQRAAVSQPSAGAAGGTAVSLLGTTGFATAQVVPPGSQTYGTFGNRTLGQSFVPTPSTFGGGIQTGPGGNFLSVGRSNGPALNATPGPQIGPQAAGGTPENMGAAEEGLEMLPGIVPPAASPAAARQYGTGAASPGSHGVQSYTRSERLSDFLTRIARSKGILAGQAIDVYLSNNVALVQGAVHRPGDRVLLANVLNLEPEVSRIDNRLVVEGASTAASK